MKISLSEVPEGQEALNDSAFRTLDKHYLIKTKLIQSIQITRPSGREVFQFNRDLVYK